MICLFNLGGLIKTIEIFTIYVFDEDSWCKNRGLALELWTFPKCKSAKGEKKKLEKWEIRYEWCWVVFIREKKRADSLYKHGTNSKSSFSVFESQQTS